MGLFLLELPAASGLTKKDGVDAMVVEADDATAAKELASTRFGGDSPWSQATATTIAAGVAADYSGWTYRIQLRGGAMVTPLDLTRVAGAETVDQIGTALATAINAASSEIAGAAYDTGTNVLTVAETTDARGNATLQVDITPPGHSEPMASMRSTIVHQGAAGAAVSCVLVAPTAIPAVLRLLRQR